MLDRLPATYRQAILVTEFEGVTQATAAGQLGLSVSGMKTRVQRARRQLKQSLLDCCHVNLDARGGVNSFYLHDPTCAPCAPAPDEAATTGDPRPGEQPRLVDTCGFRKRSVGPATATSPLRTPLPSGQ